MSVEWAEVARKTPRTLGFGKLLPDALYVHVSALDKLDPILRSAEKRAREIAGDDTGESTLIKFSLMQQSVSLLVYPNFETDPHPTLLRSVQVDLESGSVRRLDYAGSDNPFLLHRKETFLHPSHPLHAQFAALTVQEENAGLLENPASIGTRRGWQNRLNGTDLCLVGHTLATTGSAQAKIDRHKAAIVRNDLSRPVRLALEYGLFKPDTTFFDYGCGHGGDIERVAALGYKSSGWDPYYQPRVDPEPADIVNIGYVINVIEDLRERTDALSAAWRLARRALIVSAQVTFANTGQAQSVYGDGVVTSRNTFQKYYEQEELKRYIDGVLGVDSVPVAPGVYFVFRDDVLAQNFRASRFHSRAPVPRVLSQVKSFEQGKELLAPLVDFLLERGRMPARGELFAETSIAAEFGSLEKAYRVIVQATGSEGWASVAERRRKELTLYLALGKFSGRPKLAALPKALKHDIKSFFGNYNNACTASDDMLFSLGRQESIAECCALSPIGFSHRDSLYVHVDALGSLDPLLRLYEGCASRVFGCMDGANVVRLRVSRPQVYYLTYADFNDEPHPRLMMSMRVDLKDLRVNLRDYANDEDPPVLWRKEALVGEEHPLRAKFARLSEQEQRWGLFEGGRSLNTLRDLQRRLAFIGAELRGHRLIRQKV